MDKEKKDELKKKAQKTAIAATTAASLFVNNAYDTPSEIINESYEEEDLTKYINKKKVSSFKVKCQQLLHNLPQPIRIALLLPLWSVGWFLMFLFRFIWDNLLVGVAAEISYWLVLFLIVLAIVLISTLIVFPGLPLSKTFNRKTVSLILALLVALAVGDKLISINYPAYNDFKQYVKSVSCIIIVIISLVYIYFKTRKLKFRITDDKYTFSN
ncbi:MAG: hypothetical protein ACOX1F_05300 [Erysipelotrichaceae bacterium]|jgi:hypothetical protein